MKKIILLIPVLFFLASSGLMANKTSVEIKAPGEIKKGAEVTIVVNVNHIGNSKSHHTDWVFLTINGKEVKRWAYNKESLPPGGNFTVEFTYVVNEDITVVAEGHCNLHGSAGEKSVTIKAI